MFTDKRVGWGLLGLGIIVGVFFHAWFGLAAYLVGLVALVAGCISLGRGIKNHPDTIAAKPAEGPTETSPSEDSDK